MFLCPNCNARLARVQNPHGIFWACPACEGRLVSVAVLRRVVNQEHVDWVWAQAREGKGEENRFCPLCHRLMLEVSSGSSPNAPKLDVCRFCTYVWFDPEEFDELTVLPKLDQTSTRTLRQWNAPITAYGVPRISPREQDRARDPAQEAREALAIGRVKQMAEDAQDKPEEWWKMIPAFLGIPVEISGHKIEKVPYVTWLLAAAVSAVSIFAFFSGKDVIDRYAMIPAEIFRMGGLTLLTSFFLHGGWFHLLSNMYFLVTFGDNVEDYLGKGRFLLLTYLAAIFGNVLHALLDPRSTMPCVGASGGISGLVTFYVLKFPNVKLGFYYWLFFRPIWIKISALGFFLLWVGLQFFGAYSQMKGFGHVSALAHLGGAAVGVIFYLIWRKRG